MGFISTEDLKSLIDSKGEYVLVDVRDQSELSYGMIPTAVHLPLDQLGDGLKLSVEQFKDKFGFEKIDFGANVIFYCRTGSRSDFATNIALGQGFKNAKNYSGSIWEWSEIDENVKRY